MDDNSENRLHQVFFYGLYMDPDILANKGVQIRQPQKAWVDNYELRIGNKATLLRARNKRAYGMLYALTHEEINALYWGAGLNEYVAEALLVNTDTSSVAALCCNLKIPPDGHESNAEYLQKLKKTMDKLQLPVLFS